MSSLRSGTGPSPAPFRVPRVARAAPILMAAALVAGCAQTTTHTAYTDPSVAQAPYQVAAEPGRKPDLEDDGREAQIPPPRRSRPEVDDPREPWSRNYGSAQPSARADAGPAHAPPGAIDTTQRAALGAIVRGPLPSDLPADFRRRLASATGD